MLTLEVTITHKLDEEIEVGILLERRLIALDWGRKGPDPTAYKNSKARSQVKLFHRMRTEGAAVIAAYKGVTEKRGDRLIGWVEPGTGFVLDVNGLLGLPLASARIVDSSRNFLGNLAPRQCTLQPCHERARGRLAALVLGHELPRSVGTLHHLDVEWLVTNYLVTIEGCTAVWSGGRSFESLDHVGRRPGGREVLAQTTVSEGFVKEKATRLIELADDSRDLVMFGPAVAAGACPPGVRYISIEDVFSRIDASADGRWLIDRMLWGSTG